MAKVRQNILFFTTKEVAVKQRLFVFFALVIALAVLVAACAPTPAPTQAPAQPTKVEPTKAPAQPATVEPTKAPAPAMTYKPEYKLSVRTADNTGWGKGAQKFADLVKEKTGGKMNIKVYFNGQLFADKQTNEFPLLGEGVADFAVGSTINWSPQVKELNLFVLPFMFKDYKEMDAVTSGNVGKEIFKILEAKNVVGLAWGENGFRELTNSKRAITKPEDLAGLKIRVVGTKLFIDTFTALGANPTAMNWGEAITAFQQGVVDGQENPVVGVIIPYKVYDFHKHLTVWHYANDPLIFAVNKDVWQSFDDATKKIVQDAANEAALYEKALVRVGLDDGAALKYLQSKNEKIDITDPYDFLKKQGVTVTSLDANQLAAFKTKTQPVFETWSKEVGQTLVDLAQKDKAGK